VRKAGSLFVVIAALLAPAAARAQDPTVLGSLTSTSCPGSGCLGLSALAGRTTAIVEVSGTWAGSLSVEITASNAAVAVFAAGTHAKSAAITANGVYLAPMSGASVRVRATSLTSGAATVRLTAGQGGQLDLPAGAAADASLAALLTDAQLRATPVPVSDAALATAIAGNTAPSPAGVVQVGGVNADGGNLAALPINDGAPLATDLGVVTRNIPGGTQAVSAAALPLPSGAATSGLQTTLNGKLLDASEHAYTATINNFVDVGGSVAGATQVDATFSTANFDGTMVYQVSRDGGATYTTWPVIRVYPISGATLANNGAATWVAGSPALSEFIVAVPAGVTHARFTTTSYGSGTMAATMVASGKPTSYEGMTIQAEGFGTPHTGVLVGGTDGTFFKAIPIAGGPVTSEFGGGVFTHVASASPQARTMLQGTSPWAVSLATLPALTAGSA
jgi:hypothetical protein